MIKRALALLFLATPLFGAPAQWLDFDQAFGDAAATAFLEAPQFFDFTVTDGDYDPAPMWWMVGLPPGKHKSFTILGWVRLMGGNPLKTDAMTTFCQFTGDPITHESPDLLAGAWGWGDNDPITLSGTPITRAFPYGTYTNNHPAVGKWWNRGVYTVASDLEAPATLSLGGEVLELPAGKSDRNTYPGDGPDVSVTGSGTGRIGISLTPINRYHYFVDGVAEGSLMTSNSIVTNELVQVAWRAKLFDGGEHLARSSISRMSGGFGALSITHALSERPLGDTYDSRGRYMVGLVGFPAAWPWRVEWWGVRVYPRWVEDGEMEQILEGDIKEIQKRGIPRWRVME